MNLKPAHPVRDRTVLTWLPTQPSPAARSQNAEAIAWRSTLPSGYPGRSPECSFTMQAKATKLNKHGAAVQLVRELLVGSVVSVITGKAPSSRPAWCAVSGSGGRLQVRNRVCRAGRTGGNLLGNQLPAEHLKRLTRKRGRRTAHPLRKGLPRAWMAWGSLKLALRDWTLRVAVAKLPSESLIWAWIV